MNKPDAATSCEIAFRQLRWAWATCLCLGCAHVENPWVDDSPSAAGGYESPTVKDVYARFEPSEVRTRDWEPMTATPRSGRVTHWPLYFEDPFEDKGSGHDGYYVGWEDYVAMPYGLARFTANWLLLPVSAVVTPPWTLMESDGVLSRQALGYDHDAQRAPCPCPSDETGSVARRESSASAPPAETAPSIPNGPTQP